MDATIRHLRLDLAESELIRHGRHVLCAYAMRPKPGHDYLATAAQLAAQSSGSAARNPAPEDIARERELEPFVYEADAGRELVKVAYPVELFGRNVLDGRAMVVSFVTLTVCYDRTVPDVESVKLHDFFVPPSLLVLFDGPATNIQDLWRVLGRPLVNGGAIIGGIIKPELGLRPHRFADACYDFWLGGDFVKDDDPQGSPVYAPLEETMSRVADAMRRAQDATGEAKLFSANITADDPLEMIARGEKILAAFGENASHVAFQVDGYLAGPTAVTTCRRHFPDHFLHYHRAGNGAVTSPHANRGYTGLVHCKLARLLGASGMHTSGMAQSRVEGDRRAAHMLERDVAPGPYFRQEWCGMKPTTPVISGAMTALRLPALFDSLGHANVIETAAGGVFWHKDGATAGARSLRQAHEAWRQGIRLIDYAKGHSELRGAFETFQDDADRLHPGWREVLGVAA